MATTNKKSKKFVQQILTNPSNKIEKTVYLSKNELPEESLARILLTGIIKNQFYRSADDAVNEALPLIMDRAKKTPEFLLKAACVARNSHMKGMVKVAVAALNAQASDDFLINNRKAIVSLLGTFHPGQLIQFVELCKSKKFGKGFGSRAQKWVRDVMENWPLPKLENYTLIYPKDLNALVRLVHPRYTDKRQGVIVYVLDSNKANEATGKKQLAVEKMKKLSDKKDIAKQMVENEIPWDVVKGFAGLDGPMAFAVLSQMNLTGLLLNIRSLEQHGAFGSTKGLELLKLKMDEVKNGRALPIDFAKPYIHTSNNEVREILLEAMADTLSVSYPEIEKLNIGVSIDISGSMMGETLQTAGLLAVPFLKANNLWFTTFDTSLYEEGNGLCPKINGLRGKNQIKNLLGLRAVGGTDISLPIKQAIRSKKKLDVMVIITDEQQNSGSPLMKEWSNYLRTVNSNAKLWIVNATNYQWHSADFGNPSVTVYQTMSSALFKNLEYVGQNIIEAINKFDLEKMK